MSARIAICAAQVPFTRGGAEVLYETLRAELERRGHRAEIVALPFNWSSRQAILRSALAWRMVELGDSAGERIDLVIATRFPSYVVRHPRKVVWLIHQFRQIYDLAGTRFSDFGTRPGDDGVAGMIRAIDQRALGEARARFSISANTAERLRRFNQLDAEPLHPPPAHGDRYRSGPLASRIPPDSSPRAATSRSRPRRGRKVVGVMTASQLGRPDDAVLDTLRQLTRPECVCKAVGLDRAGRFFRLLEKSAEKSNRTVECMITDAITMEIGRVLRAGSGDGHGGE